MSEGGHGGPSGAAHSCLLEGGGQHLHADAAGMPLVELGRQMNIVDGGDKYVKPRNVGILFFHECAGEVPARHADRRGDFPERPGRAANSSRRRSMAPYTSRCATPSGISRTASFGRRSSSGRIGRKQPHLQLPLSRYRGIGGQRRLPPKLRDCGSRSRYGSTRMESRSSATRALILPSGSKPSTARRSWPGDTETAVSGSS